MLLAIISLLGRIRESLKQLTGRDATDWGSETGADEQVSIIGSDSGLSTASQATPEDEHSRPDEANQENGDDAAPSEPALDAYEGDKAAEQGLRSAAGTHDELGPPAGSGEKLQPSGEQEVHEQRSVPEQDVQRLDLPKEGPDSTDEKDEAAALQDDVLLAWEEEEERFARLYESGLAKSSEQDLITAPLEDQPPASSSEVLKAESETSFGDQNLEEAPSAQEDQSALRDEDEAPPVVIVEEPDQPLDEAEPLEAPDGRPGPASTVSEEPTVVESDESPFATAEVEPGIDEPLGAPPEVEPVGAVAADELEEVEEEPPLGARPDDEPVGGVSADEPGGVEEPLGAPPDDEPVGGVSADEPEGVVEPVGGVSADELEGVGEPGGARPDDEPEEVGEPLGTDLLREADDEPLTATADEAGTGLQDSLEQAVTPEEPVQAEPEEQPYERGGRWYFRRGDEFLVYEEATGQWVAAEETGPGTSSAAGGNAATPAGAEAATIAGEQPVDLAETAELTQVGETPVERGESSPQAGFWKCPSCGTVNGSTAASCRMCFALRP